MVDSDVEEVSEDDFLLHFDGHRMEVITEEDEREGKVVYDLELTHVLPQDSGSYTCTLSDTRTSAELHRQVLLYVVDPPKEGR